MKAIVFTGMPWSGKSEAVDIAKTMNIPVVRMGDFVWDEIKQRNLPLNPETVGRIGSQMRNDRGLDIWAKRTVEHIKKLNQQSLVIIDGARSIDEINFFKTVFKNDLVLVAIVALDSVRHARALIRNRKDDSKDINDIKERDKREISWGIDTLIKSADVVFENNDGLDEFHRKIEDLLSDILNR